MSFLSPGYLLFFPATVLLYFLLPRPCKNLWLLAASWFFYLCAGPDCFAFLLCATLVTYTGARLLERRDGQSIQTIGQQKQEPQLGGMELG